MIYNEFQGLKLSALGLGAMRLPTVNGQDSVIDEKQSSEMVDYALRNGINYFDTAWGYHGGNSEIVIGKILKQYPREKFYLASKFPGYDLNNMEKAEEIFEKQLEKCQVDYFDFYLMVFPGCEDKGRNAQRTRYTGMGHGAASWRQASLAV